MFSVAAVGVLSVAPLDWPGWGGLQGGPGSIPVILACGGKRSTKSGWGGMEGLEKGVGAPKMQIVMEQKCS